MTHPVNRMIVFALFTLTFTPLLAGESCENSGDAAERQQIREQRDQFNEAIEQGNSEAMRPILDEDVILITGTDSDVFRGQEAQVALWQGDFELAERAVYVRSSLCIRVSPIVPIALEFGSWRGVFSHDEQNFASGHYSAKWRKVEDQWRIESEVFATEDCGGSFCP